jgi:hypothetical protein
VLEAAEAIKMKGLMEHSLGASTVAGHDLAAQFTNVYMGMGGEFSSWAAKSAINA